METENKQIQKSFYKVEENLSLLHGMGENLRIVSEGINSEEPSLATALYGIARVIEGQIQEIENKLLNRTTSTYNKKKELKRMNDDKAVELINEWLELAKEVGDMNLNRMEYNETRYNKAIQRIEEIRAQVEEYNEHKHEN